MSKRRLDPNLLKRLSEKTGTTEKYLREQISKKASRYGISSEAELVLWAKSVGLGSSHYQRSLPVHLQQEIRETLPLVFDDAKTRTRPPLQKQRNVTPKGKPPILVAVDYLIQDEELHDRCRDLIRAPRNFDRVFREATTVLDDRLKKLSGVKRKMKPVDLVALVVNPDPEKAILKVSGGGDLSKKASLTFVRV